jgi:hypothetical protein
LQKAALSLAFVCVQHPLRASGGQPKRPNARLTALLQKSLFPVQASASAVTGLRMQVTSQLRWWDTQLASTQSDFLAGGDAISVVGDRFSFGFAQWLAQTPKPPAVLCYPWAVQRAHRAGAWGYLAVATACSTCLILRYYYDDPPSTLFISFHHQLRAGPYVHSYKEVS